MYGTNYTGRTYYGGAKPFTPTFSELFEETTEVRESFLRKVLRSFDESSQMRESTNRSVLRTFDEASQYLESLIKSISKTFDEVASLRETLLRRVVRGNIETVTAADLLGYRKVVRTNNEELQMNESLVKHVEKILVEGINLVERLIAIIPGGKYIWDTLGRVLDNVWQKTDRNNTETLTKTPRTLSLNWTSQSRSLSSLSEKMARAIDSLWSKTDRVIGSTHTKTPRALISDFEGIAKPTIEGYTKEGKALDNVSTKTDRVLSNSTTKSGRVLNKLWVKVPRNNG